MFDFIDHCLRHKSEMVIYEAAHAIVNMKHTTAKELAPAVSVLQLFCSSPKPTLRYVAYVYIATSYCHNLRKYSLQ